MKKIELLAPAKNLECGIAAIDCGADAVYIGAPQFGARENAGNSLADIAELVAHAHKFWAKVYVTVNTLLRDEELQPAIELINELYKIGVDALIIQDTALLECKLPPIPLIASTQMHNNTAEKVAFLESVGVQRVILARELDIDQIKEIREKTKLELECFVHGALCVCYSGQCYMSFGFGGRSGNRGQCAQPCRKEYTLVNGNGRRLANGHLLSLKDLNLSAQLKELIQAGISSFKIEGRLKDKPYVMNVVSYYRQKLDAAIAELGLAKSSSGRSEIDFIPNPEKTFNRGYTEYFLHGRREPVGSPETPKMLGEVIGRITSVSPRGITIDTNKSLHPGDGICFFNKLGELHGTGIYKVLGRTIFPDRAEGLERTTMVYRNHDHEFLTALDKSVPKRAIDISLKLTDTPDGLALTASDEDGNTAEFAMECAKEPAQKPEQAMENIKKQLTKTGGTGFACSDLAIELSETPFVPMSTLNALRRGALDKLTEIRSAARPTTKGGAIRNSIPYPETTLSYTGNVLNSKAEDFYRRHGVTDIRPAAEAGLDMRGNKVMTTRYCIKYQLGLCGKRGEAQKIREPLALVDAEGRRLELKFDCVTCEMEVWLKRQVGPPTSVRDSEQQEPS